MNKRMLLTLVKGVYVTGWDDPRMPTLAGMRRRGYPPEAIRDFSDRIGVAKANSIVDYELLQFCIRDVLNKKAQRAMVVLNPLKVTLENYPEGQVEELDAQNNPEDDTAGMRKIPFSKVIYIEREDFREAAPANWFRLAPGREVRLKHAYYITCKEVVKDEEGNVTELICTYDPASRGGWTPDNRKVKGTLHWVSAAANVPVEVRLYEHLFTKADPTDTEEGKTWLDYLNPNSLQVVTALAEPMLKDAKAGEQYQFLRLGYFCTDPDSTPAKPVFNRIVTLKDTWAKLESK